MTREGENQCERISPFSDPGIITKKSPSADGLRVFRIGKINNQILPILPIQRNHPLIYSHRPRWQKTE